MTDTERAILKKRVDNYGRFKLAQEIGMTYSLLSQRLLGYLKFRDGEVEQIEKVLGGNSGQ